MTIKDYVQTNLLPVDRGTPILLTTQAREIERFQGDDAKGDRLRNYLLKWGGMQNGDLFGFSKDGTVAYPCAFGEIFRLDQLAEAWGHKPTLVPVRVVDDKGLSYMTLERNPERVLIGREAILAGVTDNDLAEYKPLLEELL